ncbi:MAG TPA: 30S ribosomal protein S16 [Stenomitos sp.]
MVKIRLKRVGATKHPKYRMVVADGRVRRDGRVIEEIGFYDPQKEPAEVRINEEAALKWLRNGAQPTEVARELLKKIGAFDKLAAK